MIESGLDMVRENGKALGLENLLEEHMERVVAFGRALSDPIRVRMLGMMSGGRGCCDLPDCGVPAEDQDAGICVCEFERYFGIGQSKVSYHLKKLKEAGLIREEKRGKWSFYSLSKEAARKLLVDVDGLLASRDVSCVMAGES